MLLTQVIESPLPVNQSSCDLFQLLALMLAFLPRTEAVQYEQTPKGNVTILVMRSALSPFKLVCYFAGTKRQDIWMNFIIIYCIFVMNFVSIFCT